MGLHQTGYHVHDFRGEVGNVYSLAAADGAITCKSGVVFITKGSAAALTIADPVSGSPEVGGDDGKRLVILALTAHAHTVTRTTTGFNDAGASGDVATFGGAKGDAMVILAYGGKWYTEDLRNVTLG